MTGVQHRSAFSFEPPTPKPLFQLTPTMTSYKRNTLVFNCMPAPLGCVPSPISHPHPIPLPLGHHDNPILMLPSSFPVYPGSPRADWTSVPHGRGSPRLKSSRAYCSCSRTKLAHPRLRSPSPTHRITPYATPPTHLTAFDARTYPLCTPADPMPNSIRNPSLPHTHTKLQRAILGTSQG